MTETNPRTTAKPIAPRLSPEEEHAGFNRMLEGFERANQRPSAFRPAVVPTGSLADAPF